MDLTDNDSDSMDLSDSEQQPGCSGPIFIPRAIHNPFTELNDKNFRSRYLFSKAFSSRILELVEDRLPTDVDMGPQLQVACALRSWGRVENYDFTADLHGVTQSVLSKVCSNVATAIAGLRSNFIKMPANLVECSNNMEKFKAIADFPRVIGIIDCMRIKITRTNINDHGQSSNSTGNSSIIVQAVCDADLKIMDIVAGWSGNAIDSKKFWECRLKDRFKAHVYRGVLLGDGGYPCSPYLLTPYINPNTAPEEIYNVAHRRTQNTIDRCFGLWKQRFRCLSRGINGKIETTKKTILACAVLHNIAIDMRENLHPEFQQHLHQENSFIPKIRHPYTLRGILIREQFIRKYYPMTIFGTDT